MWWSLPMILLTGWISLSYSDIEHDSALHAVVMPLLCLSSVAALVIWLMMFMHRLAGRGSGRPGDRFDVGVSTDIDAGGGD